VVPEVKDSLEVLRRYGIRYRVFGGEVSIHYDDLKRFLRLCDEGKVPRSLC